MSQPQREEDSTEGRLKEWNAQASRRASRAERTICFRQAALASRRTVSISRAGMFLPNQCAQVNLRGPSYAAGACLLRQGLRDSSRDQRFHDRVPGREWMNTVFAQRGRKTVAFVLHG